MVAIKNLNILSLWNGLSSIASYHLFGAWALVWQPFQFMACILWHGHSLQMAINYLWHGFVAGYIFPLWHGFAALHHYYAVSAWTFVVVFHFFSHGPSPPFVSPCLSYTPEKDYALVKGSAAIDICAKLKKWKKMRLFANAKGSWWWFYFETEAPVW